MDAARDASLTVDLPVDEWKLEVRRRSEEIRRQLPEGLAITRLRPVDAASWNAIFRAEAPGQRYCIKVMNEERFHVGWSVDELHGAGQAMAALRSAGLDTVLPPIAAGDRPLACRCAGYTVMVFPWCSHFDTPVASRDDAFVRAGAPALHELHLHGAQLAVAGAPPTVFPRKYGPSAWAAAADRLWEQSATTLERAGAPPSLRRLLVQAQRTVPALLARFPAFFSTHREGETLLHGDFRPENVLIDGYRMRLIYDFDFHRVGLPEEDVAYAALAFSGPRWFTGSRDWGACAAFLRTYQQAARDRGRAALRAHLLEPALIWTLLKELSLSFRPVEVPGRHALWQELCAELPGLVEAVR